MQKAVVIYSGGMDSFTLLNDVLYGENFDTVVALSFNYGQRHSKELEYAARACEELKMTHKIVDITAINGLLQGSSLTSDVNVPEGHYEEESMKATVVPNRNMILLSLAVGYAVSIEADVVFYGAHGGDHAIYPDCRPEFVDAMNRVTQTANWYPVTILAPYLHLDKGDIAFRGHELGLDYGKAWTCYNGREKACGKCGACQERIEAMAGAGIDDPMEYE
jgi:7-cyano-7-deazaguanine synthase